MSYLDDRRNFINSGRPLPEKKKHTINKVSPKRQKKLDEMKAAGTDSEMDKFFASLRKGMTGRCFFCNGKSEKLNDEKYFFSLAHLLPKAIFKSVATMPENIIELCFFGESCHTNFDNGMITWETLKDSKEWDILRERLLIILPAVSDEERKHKLYDKLINLVYGKV